MADITPPIRTENFFDEFGRPTLRFSEFLDSLSASVNVQSVQTDTNLLDLSAKIADLQNQIGSGDALTSDDTGLTVDLDTLTVDMTEA